MNMDEVFYRHGTDKHFHGYGKVYEDFISVQTKSLLEIGIKKGRSLTAWRDILPYADLYGMDITDKEWIEDRIKYSKAKTFIADSTKKGSEDLIKNVEVIIDDGSHYPDDQLKTLENFKDKFNQYYVIEDVVADLYDVLTGIKNLGFNDFYVHRSEDLRGKMKFLKSYFMEKNENYFIEQKREDYYLPIHCVVIRR